MLILHLHVCPGQSQGTQHLFLWGYADTRELVARMASCESCLLSAWILDICNPHIDSNMSIIHASSDVARGHHSLEKMHA